MTGEPVEFPVCIVIEHPFEVVMEVPAQGNGVFVLESLRPIGDADEYVVDGYPIPPNTFGLSTMKIESTLDTSRVPVVLDVLLPEGRSVPGIPFSRLAPLQITIKPPEPCTFSVVLRARFIGTPP